ncbi:MAG TPA: hypothetical protein VFY29_17400 [Terriglobia bacterium]|nr:hypothetical protein [Terriglobia bacterium]
MRKALITIGVLIAALAILTAARAPQKKQSAGAGISVGAADALQSKIDTLKKKSEETTAGADPRPTEEIQVSESELASYVMHSLREQIPVQVEAFKVQLTAGAVGADAELNIAEPTGAALVDALVGGRHSLFVKGKLSGAERRGRFELDEVRVDGIPVPKVLVETLFTKYVKPRYPYADLKEPFDLPWGIERLTIEPKKAHILY